MPEGRSDMQVNLQAASVLNRTRFVPPPRRLCRLRKTNMRAKVCYGETSLGTATSQNSSWFPTDAGVLAIQLKIQVQKLVTRSGRARLAY